MFSVVKVLQFEYESNDNVDFAKGLLVPSPTISFL